MFPTDLGGFKPGFAELAGAQHLCSGSVLAALTTPTSN